MKFFPDKPQPWSFNLRDNIALQALQTLLAAGRFPNSYAGATVEAYEIADAFLERWMIEKRAGN